MLALRLFFYKICLHFIIYTVLSRLCNIRNTAVPQLDIHMSLAEIIVIIFLLCSLGRENNQSALELIWLMRHWNRYYSSIGCKTTGPCLVEKLPQLRYLQKYSTRSYRTTVLYISPRERTIVKIGCIGCLPLERTLPCTPDPPSATRSHSSRVPEWLPSRHDMCIGL